VQFEPWFSSGAAPPTEFSGGAASAVGFSDGLASPTGSSGGAAPATGYARLDRDEALAGLAEAVGSLARFVGAAVVTLGRVSPPSLRPALARALRGVSAVGE
jgi:hypothetical protein